MDTPQDKQTAAISPADEAAEYLPGIWVNLDGGEEDRTIRPSQVLPRLRGRGHAQPAEGSNGEPTSTPSVSGSDLEDWLNRSFD
jgi:hypothetical protein